MKITRKKMLSVLLLLAIICNIILPNLSLAVGTGVAEAKVVLSKTEVQRGEEVTVSYYLNTNGASGITLSQAYINFDPNIVEPVGNPTLNSKFSSTVPATPATVLSVTNNENVHRVNLLWTSGANDFALDYNGEVCSQVFKVKENATLGESSFTISENVPVVGGLNPSTGENVNVEFTVKNASINIVQPVDSISLDKTAEELWAGETTKLNVTYLPEDASGKTVTWKSDNNAVATVSTNGTVTAKAKGTATITATTANGKKASCAITVKQPVTGITLDKTSVELEKGQQTTLTATVLPANADGDKTVTWSTSKSSVATVSNGVVTAVGKGSATITATTANGKTASCTVTVGVPLKSISFKDNASQKIMNKGDNFTLEVVYNPEDTDSDKTITWSSTDTSVATVKNGVVTAVGGGETEITATTANGKNATCKITVEVPLEKISIKGETSIQYGQTEKLIVTYNPVDTTSDKTIKWTSSNESIATVATDGTITAVGVGNSVITATTVDGKTASCTVTVLPIELNTISIKEQNIVLNKEQEKNLTVTYNPENTTEDKTVTWETSDSSIVSVSDTGVIKALKAGEATITAKVGDKTAQTLVTVEVPLESISLNETEKTVNKGEKLQLTVTYNPEDTTENKEVTWSTTDNSIAKVDKNGNVTALKAGTAYIKAKVQDKEVSCKVNVVVPLKSIELNKEKTTIIKGQAEQLKVTLSPEDTTYTGKVEWSSSDNTIATVDENGNVKAIKAGEVTITAKATDGEEITDTCTVTVEEIPLNSVTINSKDFELEIGNTKQLEAIIEPENTTEDVKVEWSSSNDNIVSVNEEGLVTAISEGTAVITAKAGEKTATVTVIAKAIPIKSIILEGTETKVLIGSAINTKITVNPSNSKYNIEDFKFISSNSDILYVNEDGKVIAKGEGKAILTVEAPNGVKSQIEIEVVTSPGEVSNEQNEQIEATTNTSTNVNNSNSPKTGDIAVEFLVALMLISGIGIAVIIRKNIKK